MRIFSLALCLLVTGAAAADPIRQTKGEFYDAFRQLGTALPTPNDYRTASGAPGHEYWQQRADYDIQVTLDDEKHVLSAEQTVTYTNNSPDELRYLWVQLDQNRFRTDSLDQRSRTAPDPANYPESPTTDILTYGKLAQHHSLSDRPHGYQISRLVDQRGNNLAYVVRDTMLRIDLPSPLKPGQRFRFRIDYSFNIPEEPRVGSRGGYEHFPETDTYQYFLAQWFPRMTAYTDYDGWNNFAFLGRGEFALEFGNYRVAITVPRGHVVAATGELQNPGDVLTATQQQRLRDAADAKAPVFVITPEEAKANEQQRLDGTRTWVFEAENVRDFAFTSSRKYIWDAQGYRQPGTEQPLVMAMSFYPNEAEPIWSRYSTEAVIHTMEVYSRFSFPYPYPTSQSVNTWERGGMEYPMMTFNGYRPEPFEPPEDAEPPENAPDVTYSRDIKYRLIGVIIHEVGHNYFPMIVNSDERQWTWMDEGINTFLEMVAEIEWEERYPVVGAEYKGLLNYIPSYMVADNQVPIMTQSDAILQFGNNAYLKPAAALMVLRETVMGRELFDHAFREYSRRWQFKRPTPADFFRTMEDASAVDLDWFWRGWFYSTDHVDVAITGVREYRIANPNPDVEAAEQRKLHEQRTPEVATQRRNREEGLQTRLQRRPGLADFYNENDPFTVSNKDRNDAMEAWEALEDWEQATLKRGVEEDPYVYFIDFKNIGGLVSPLPLELHFADGSKTPLDIPAEVWRRNASEITKLLILPKKLARLVLDPGHETADADYANNEFPSRIQPSRLALYKRDDDERNLMADMLSSLREEEQEKSTDAVPLTSDDAP